MWVCNKRQFRNNINFWPPFWFIFEPALSTILMWCVHATLKKCSNQTTGFRPRRESGSCAALFCCSSYRCLSRTLQPPNRICSPSQRKKHFVGIWTILGKNIPKLLILLHVIDMDLLVFPKWLWLLQLNPYESTLTFTIPELRECPKVATCTLSIVQ